MQIFLLFIGADIHLEAFAFYLPLVKRICYSVTE